MDAQFWFNMGISELLGPYLHVYGSKIIIPLFLSKNIVFEGSSGSTWPELVRTSSPDGFKIGQDGPNMGSRWSPDGLQTA
jgi:hypothetical protein